MQLISQLSGHGRDKILLSAHRALCAYHGAFDTPHIPPEPLGRSVGAFYYHLASVPDSAAEFNDLQNTRLLSLPKISCWIPQTDIFPDLTNRYLSSPLHQQITRTIRTCLISLTPMVFLLIYSKLSGMGIGAELWGGHTHCHLPPLPTGAGGWIASAHILMARAPPLRKNIHIYPNLDFH